MPLAITIWVLHAVLNTLDGVFEALLTASHAVLPEAAYGPLQMLKQVPGLGVIVMVAGLLLTGVFAANFAGQWALAQGSRLLTHIPIVKSIYSSVKQVSDTLFSSSGNAFREAVLVQYPREGSWTIAFVTGKTGGEAAEHLHDASRVRDTAPDAAVHHRARRRRPARGVRQCRCHAALGPPSVAGRAADG